MLPAVNDAVAQIAAAGFDLVHAFDARGAAREPGWERLAAGDALGLLVGNTRALWPRFVAARRDPALAGAPHPLERYTEQTLEAAFAGAVIYYAHRVHDGAFLPFQRLAVATGLAALAPSHLLIHPSYGPWFALRAVVVVDGTPPVRAPIAPPCRCDERCHRALATARTAQTAQTAQTWQPWLAVRDACSLAAWRYSDEQIRYHYERGLLARGGVTQPAPEDR